MYYAICNSEDENKPWSIFHFSSMAKIKNCPLIDENSVVYTDSNPIYQLIENYQWDELQGLWCSIILNDRKAHQHHLEDYLEYQRGPNKFYSKEKTAQKLHDLVLYCMKPWNKEKKMPEIVSVNTFNNKAEKAEKAVAPVKVTEDTKIVALLKEPPIRSGTNRYRNMEVVMSSSTVTQALEKLKALSPAPGSRVDINIAVKAGAIKLEE